MEGTVQRSETTALVLAVAKRQVVSEEDPSSHCTHPTNLLHTYSTVSIMSTINNSQPILNGDELRGGTFTTRRRA